MKVIIAGTRTITDPAVLASAIRAANFHISHVVSGGALGADLLGEKWAEERNLPVTKFPADWDKHGRAAGPIRNNQMAEYADALIAIWDGVSPGTRNIIGLMSTREKPVYVHRI